MQNKKANTKQALLLYTTLYQALLLDKKMEQALYEFDLEEHIEHWKQEVNQKKDDFIFVVTENNGDVAMVLITKKNTVFINDNARKKLKLLFKAAYRENIETILPNMVLDLLGENLAINSVKFQKK